MDPDLPNQVPLSSLLGISTLHVFEATLGEPFERLLYLYFEQVTGSAGETVEFGGGAEQCNGYSNCDGSYFNCNVVKSGALTIAMLINEAVKDSDCYCRLFIAPRRR